MNTRIAIVGSGYMAEEYLKASEALDNFDVVAIYSRNRKTSSNLAIAFDIPNVVEQLQDLSELDLHFLIICVPELETPKIIEGAAPLNLPMLVEKPIGHTFEIAKSIESLAVEKGIPLFAALNRRFYSSSIQVFEELENSQLPRFIQVTDQENTIAALASGQPSEVVENWMFANSIHIIDFIARAGRGKPTVFNKRTIYLTELSYIKKAEISFSSGDTASYTCYWNAPAGWSVNISTAEKSWQLAPLENARSRNLVDRQYLEFEVDPLDSFYKPGLVRLLRDVQKFSSGSSHALTPISEANRTMELIEMIYSSD